MAEAYSEHGPRPVPDAKLLMKARRAKTYRERVEGYRKEMEANPNDPRHGTKAGYSYGCRCERCRAAKRSEKRYKPKSMEFVSKNKEVGKRNASRIWWLLHHGVPKSKIAAFLCVDESCIDAALDDAGYGKLEGTDNGQSSASASKYPDVIG